MTRRELFAALIAPLVAVKAIAAPRKANAISDFPLCPFCFDRGVGMVVQETITREELERRLSEQ